MGVARNASLDELRAALTTRPLHVWVIGYGITHHVMELAFFPPDHFIRHDVLVCGGVSGFHGEFEGGPYDLAVELGADPTEFVLRDRSGRFGFRFARALIKRRREGSLRQG